MDTKSKYSLGQQNKQKVAYSIPDFVDTTNISLELRGKLEQIGRDMLSKR